MADERKLLVVDDEEVVCQACRRIFSRQGFQVETHTDARQGLVKATENDYAIILLDIKMPHMDGIQFLERLREKKPDVPVLIITGYPSIPNAAAAMRLGACDYVTKPFTSEEVTWGMQRVLNMQHVLNDEGETVAQEREAVVTAMANIETLFWDESWVQLAVDGSALVGAVLPGLHGASITGIRMPKIGEVVYQGLPLAGVSLSGKPMLVIPSPISGVVAEVNSLVAHRPQLLASDPCGEGWIAGICATRHEEMANCKPRRLLLVNSDPCSADEQTRKLTDLGCQVEKAAEPGRPVRRLGRKRRTRRFSWMPLRWARRGRAWSNASTGRPPTHASWSSARQAAPGKPRIESTRSSITPSSPSPTTKSPTSSWACFAPAEAPTGQDRTPQGTIGADQQHLDHQPQPAQGPVVGRAGAALGQ